MATSKSKHRLGRWLPSPVRAILEWIGQHELSVLVAMLLLVGSVWLFMAVADQVMEGDTKAFDEWAVRVLRQQEDLAVPRGPHWLHEMGRDFTALGGIGFLAFLTVTVVGFLWIKRMYAAMLLVLAATLGGLVASLLLKMAYDRPRPNIVPHLSITMTSSFPSGHAMLSTTVFLTLGTLMGTFVRERMLKAYFLILAVVLSILVGISRVYLGVHYPTDVLTGWVAGLAWAITCWLVSRSMQKRHIVEGELGELTR